MEINLKGHSVASCCFQDHQISSAGVSQGPEEGLTSLRKGLHIFSLWLLGYSVLSTEHSRRNVCICLCAYLIFKLQKQSFWLKKDFSLHSLGPLKLGAVWGAFSWLEDTLKCASLLCPSGNIAHLISDIAAHDIFITNQSSALCLSTAIRWRSFSNWSGVTPVKHWSPQLFVVGAEFWKVQSGLHYYWLSLAVDLLKLDLLKCNVLSHIDLCVKIKFPPAVSFEGPFPSDYPMVSPQCRHHMTTHRNSRNPQDHLWPMPHTVRSSKTLPSFVCQPQQPGRPVN